MQRQYKVTLLGYYGMGNLGDELLASASIELTESCGVPRDRIAMLSGDPEESRATHKIFAADRWDMKKIISLLRRTEILILGGGGIFQDSSGPRSPAYYWAIVRAAKLCGCKVMAVGQSIGPLSRFYNRALTRDAFRCCSSVSVRDVHSLEFLKRNRIRTGASVVGAGRTVSCEGTDAIYTDDLALARDVKIEANEKKDVVLVNFRSVRALMLSGKNLEKAAAEAFKNFRVPAGVQVLGVAMDKSDAETMEQLARCGAIKIEKILTPTLDDAEKIFSRARAGLGMRLHFGVMCLRARIPFTMIPYDPKVTDFAHRWNALLWSESFCEKQENQKNQEFCTELNFDEIRQKIRNDFRACYEKTTRDGQP